MALREYSVTTFTIFMAIIMYRALVVFKTPPSPEPCSDTQNHSRIKLTKEALERFKIALEIPTISYGQHDYGPDQLLKLIRHIEVSFPYIHRSNFIKREIVANYTLIYTIEGRNRRLRPYMLTSHMDVVPAVPEKWSQDPFHAVVKEDGHLYARGAMDAKHLLMSMMEALETMVKNGQQPDRSFYMVFGHDEEVGGVEGAKTVADLLQKQLRDIGWNGLEYILDEGNTISETRPKGVDRPIAFIGVVEKGYVTIKLSTNGSVGHGSMPPPMTAITKLSVALSKFHSHLFPSFFGQSVEKEMLEVLARYARWPHKMFYSNVWLFRPLFEHWFSSNPTLNGFIRTTTAVTMIGGGTKENVLPDSAYALVNHRIHPLQTVQDVLDYDTAVVNDPTIQVEIGGQRSGESTPTAPYGDDAFGYQMIKRSVQQVYPGTIVSPSTFLAASDSKWYVDLTQSIYKFAAISVQLGEMKRFHGHDERISLKNYENLINFFHHLILNSDSPDLYQEPKPRAEL